MPTEIDVLNTRLKNLYGKFLDGRPWFRIVWSSSMTEKRTGRFSEFYGSIFVREYVGMAQVPKYPAPEYKDRWVLEKLFFIENKELVDDSMKGTYEPVWVFRAPGGGYQKPTWKSVEFLMGMIFTPKQKMSQTDMDNEEARLLDLEINDNYGILQSKYGGDVATALHQREAIVVPNMIGVK